MLPYNLGDLARKPLLCLLLLLLPDAGEYALQVVWLHIGVPDVFEGRIVAAGLVFHAGSLMS
jgi:hypothetical protein